jgi:predicted acetyltransferase
MVKYINDNKLIELFIIRRKRKRTYCVASDHSMIQIEKHKLLVSTVNNASLQRMNQKKIYNQTSVWVPGSKNIKVMKMHSTINYQYATAMSQKYIL